MGIPLPRPAVRPMTLATNAFSVRYSFNTTPLRIVLSSGIPEPEAQTEDREENHERAMNPEKDQHNFTHTIHLVTVILKDEK